MIFPARILLAALLGLTWSYAQTAPDEPEPAAILPTYLALSPNINEFTRFADGGTDSNWYVGYNNAWIVKLPPAPEGDYKNAFIGAKLGRAKTVPLTDKPWLRRLVPGKIYIAISPTPSFTQRSSFFLVETADIPRQSDPVAHVEGVGASQWFWAEVPPSMVSRSKPNYLVVYSPTRDFTSSETSPILAAAAADKRTNLGATLAWNNHSISGVPPRNAQKALETPINNIHPALAIKLAPASNSEVYINDLTVSPGRLNRHYVEFSVGGENIAQAWVEKSRDQLDWVRLSSIIRQPPFIFTIKKSQFPEPGNYLRGVARDVSGTTGVSGIYPIPFPVRGEALPNGEVDAGEVDEGEPGQGEVDNGDFDKEDADTP